MAKQDFRRVQIAANNVAIGHDNAVNAIESELRQTADVRLADFKHHLNYALVNDLRFALITWVNISASRRGATVVENNMPAVVAAQEACRKALAEIDALQLEPLTYADVSQWLMRTCADLAVPFAVIECNPPSLTNEHAEIGRPFKWAAGPNYNLLCGWYRNAPSLDAGTLIYNVHQLIMKAEYIPRTE